MGFNDSKQLDEKAREGLFKRMLRTPRLGWSVRASVVVCVSDIINTLHAPRLSPVGPHLLTPRITHNRIQPSQGHPLPHRRGDCGRDAPPRALLAQRPEPRHGRRPDLPGPGLYVFWVWCVDMQCSCQPIAPPEGLTAAPSHIPTILSLCSPASLLHQPFFRQQTQHSRPRA
jgi:hypothetical protein